MGRSRGRPINFFGADHREFALMFFETNPPVSRYKECE